ncbi:histidine kinase [Bordetella sputigena]|uniref:ATP-binding protein n=1 Tax=Bordetella sputigena TaxID=1416810 RepID=UPI0039EE3FEA
MNHRILSTRIASDQGLVGARDRTRQVGDVFGLEDLQRTRLVTAVSEIARNAVDYARGGRIDFGFCPASATEPQAIIVTIADDGPGITDLPAILSGTNRADGNVQLGIRGARRLVDRFHIESAPGKGTTVTLEMRLPVFHPAIEPEHLASLIEKLARRKLQTPVEELEQQNREMLLTLEQLQLRQAELERADERKDEFLAMLAHELRNPLSAIGTALELMKRKRDASPDDTRRLTALVSRQTEQLARLVNDLLDVSRVTRGKIELNHEALPVGELVDQALEMTQGAINAKRHTVDYLPPPADVWVRADRVRFRQILSNLLHNAARYTPERGLIQLEVRAGAERVEIIVRDNGIGIGADMLPRVFDLFSQADTSLGRKDAGLGIGLTLVQRLAAAHGGIVTAASEGLGQGSAFTVNMPRLAEPGAVAAAPAPAQAPSNGGLRVLLIDDNEDAVQSMRLLLQDAGHTVATAGNGEAGLASAQALAPQVVVIDIGLPDVDGFEVAAALRRSSATANSFLVALSGYTATAMMERGAKVGFNQYLSKPVDVARLEEVLRAVPREA